MCVKLMLTRGGSKEGKALNISYILWHLLVKIL